MFTTEGSGVNTKYYIQLGADTASKKELGRFNLSELRIGSISNTTIPAGTTDAILAAINYDNSNGPTAPNVSGEIVESIIGTYTRYNVLPGMAAGYVCIVLLKLTGESGKISMSFPISHAQSNGQGYIIY